MIIRNASLVDHNGERKSDLCIDGGMICTQGGGEEIDGSGLHVFPAFIDLHTHLRAPGFTHKEDVASGVLAALRGGYTTLNAMANTKPVCSDISIARQVCAQSQGLCDIFQSISMTKDFDGKTVTHLDALSGTDEFIRCVSEDGYGVADGSVFLDVLQLASKHKKVVLVHAEDATLSAVDMAVAEDLETIRDLYLVDYHCKKNGTDGLRVHFCHVSTEYSARAIIAAKERGLPVSFEVSPHHIALNDSVDFRVNPPLRPESDRRFLIKAILDSHVDAIATDHAPHTVQDKLNGAPGLVGLETAFQVCYTTLCVENKLPLTRLSGLMSFSPSKILGVNKGSLDIGKVGDVTIVDLSREVVVDSLQFASKGRNTPFDGRKYWGQVLMTIKGGEVKYRL